jgi:hypothetical protein
VKCMVGDATDLDISAGSTDVLFSNWLLMYLSDEECAKLARDALHWVRSQTFTLFSFCQLYQCFVLLLGIVMLLVAHRLGTLCRFSAFLGIEISMAIYGHPLRRGCQCWVSTFYYLPPDDCIAQGLSRPGVFVPALFIAKYACGCENVGWWQHTR